jgi:glutamyl-tRNA synthetase
MAARYRGRIAPSPTGLLHLGHAATFLCAFRRCVSEGGVLVYREEDLDAPRCRAEYSTAAREDLRWLRIRWQEGPDVGGDAGPYVQSERLAIYRERLRNLIDAGLAYPCACTRGDIARALGAPHEGEEEAVAGRDFGDFLIWRKDGFPAYQLAVVTDDALMRITEVVRGEDLVTSTFRQILLYEAFGEDAPAFAHAPLVRDEQGKRLAKRDDARSIRALREAGMSADAVIALALAGH